MSEATLERVKSTHRVEVVPIVLTPHPNADKLSLVKIFGYQVVVNTEAWKGVELAAYIVPDSVVDVSRPEFAFLADGKGETKRIKVKKLRGIVSQGLLVPAPAGSKAGDDVAEQLGVTRYEPPEPLSTGGDNEAGPPGWVPTYDVESFNRYSHLLKPGEPVIVTEKIHGASARFRWYNDRMYCGSRTSWKRQDPKNLWWRALEQNPGIIQFCQSCPDWTLYGEVFGQVQDLKYGANKNDVFFAAFDIWDGTRWLDGAEIVDGRLFQMSWVPLVYAGPFDEAKIREMAEGDSVEINRHQAGAKQLCEGVVIKPQSERTDPEIGRVQLKIVSNRYLERAGD